MSQLPFGTALALAQRTLTAPLTAVLGAEGVTAPEWFTLNALGLRGASSRTELVDLLVTNGVDGADVIATLDRTGLVEVRGEVVTLTPAGTARYTGLRDRIGAVTTRIFAPFDPDRVEAARALLEEIAGLDADELVRRTVAAR